MEKELLELSRKVYDLENELADRKEQELMARGCYACGGEIDKGSYRRTVGLSKPCSEGSMHETFVVCIECQSQIYEILTPISDRKRTGNDNWYLFKT